MHCPKCEFENPPAMRFCGQCGAPLAVVCAHCSAENPPGFKFCGTCGAGLAAPATASGPAKPLSLEEQFATLQQALPASLRDHLLTPAEGENRLVTVLFADMSSSVKTTGDLHPEEAAALVSSLLKAMVDVLLKYEGRVDRFLGDGLLAVFGTPQAHESDPERAILAALEIREAARQLGLEATAGINTGEVYVGGVGSERHQEVTVMGPVVNLASRLQGQAEPGQILVGESTYRHTRRAFAFAPLSLEVKGIAQPVVAYAVERALPRPEKARGIEGLRAELIGRDEEFAKLQDALAEVLRGRGQMVSLIGEAGVGKSRLVAELKAVVNRSADLPVGDAGQKPGATSPLLWLEGRCLELGMSASYGLFVDLFRQLFAFGPDEDEPTRGERLVAFLRELVDQSDLSEERLAEIGPLIGNLLSLRFGTEWDERLKNASPEQIKHQTFLAIRDLFVALARRQPVVLVCEDLHWADSLSLDLISLLMETLTLAPLLLLCIYRPEREHKCWHLSTIASRKCADRYAEIALRELTPQQSHRLVEALLTIEDLPGSVKELILEKSRGNPFFVEEVIRSLIASGMVYQEGEVWRAQEGIESVVVPESIQSVILSRVDRLEHELRGVLESAAVIGRLFRRRLLERTLQGARELEHSLWELEDHALIYQERVVPEEEYSFKHVLTQETIYQSILRRRRTGFHQKVAEAIEALYQEGLDEYVEQLAYHYERSGIDEKAVKYLLKAGEKARKAYLNEEAIGYLRRALEWLDRSALGETRKEWRLEALKGLGRIYFFGAGNLAEAEAYFRQAIALGHEIGLDRLELVRLYFWLGDVFWQGAQWNEIVRIGEEGRILAADAPESVEAALMNEILAVGYGGRGDHDQACEFRHRNAQFLQRLPYSEELCGPYAHIGSIYYAGSQKNVEEAMCWFAALDQKARQQHDVRASGLASYYTGLVNSFTGDLHRALLQEQSTLELFSSIGDTKHSGQCFEVAAALLLQLGDLSKAEESIARGLEIAQSMGNELHTVWALMQVGEISLCQHAWEKATEALERAAQLSRAVGLRWEEVAAGYSLGRAYLAQGRREEALSQFQAAIALSGCPSADGLSGLEEAYESPEQFRAACRCLREEHPEVAPSHFVQWYLEPADAGAVCEPPLVHDPFAGTLSPDWTWHDSFGDCSFAVQNGLEIHAANGRGLGWLNRSAPRLLRPISGDFAVQAVCGPASAEKPAIGGLLLWKDSENYLRLDRGTRGRHEISFQGCLGNKDVVIGRGRLLSDRIVLRLERQGGQVNALCSAEGTEWFTVGQVEFRIEDPVEVGLHAIGGIDRTIYPGAYPDGTAIRFESFELWR